MKSGVVVGESRRPCHLGMMVAAIVTVQWRSNWRTAMWLYLVQTLLDAWNEENGAFSRLIPLIDPHG